MDELLWAALWLYKATNNEDYLKYALNNAQAFGGTTWAIKEFSWDVKYAGVQIIASMVHKLNLDHFSTSISILISFFIIQTIV